MTSPAEPPPADGQPSRRWVRISLIEHHAYCPRQAVLIETEPWHANTETTRGDLSHARIDTGVRDSRRGVTVHHSVHLRSDQLAVYGIADTVEDSRDGTLTVVEHKSGRRPVASRAAALQATAQALCLAEMTGRNVEAVVYHAGSNSREPVSLSRHAAEVEDMLAEIRENLDADAPPTWTAKRSRCARCSLMPICQPELSQRPGRP